MSISAVPIQSDVFGVYRGPTKYLCDTPQPVSSGNVISMVDTSSWFNYPMTRPWHYGFSVTEELKEKWSAEVTVRGSADSTTWVPLASFKTGTYVEENANYNLQKVGRDSFDTDTLYRYYSFEVASAQSWEDGTVVTDSTVANMRIGIQAPA